MCGGGGGGGGGGGTAFPTIMQVCPAKSPISLRIRSV